MISAPFFKSGTAARHAFVQAFRQNFLITVFGLAVFCILIPISTAGLPEYSIFNIDHTHDQMKFRFFAGNFTAAVNAAVIIYGAALGIILFRFMLDKRQAAVFFSLGLTRKKLFLIRSSVGLTIIILAIVVPLAVSLLLNAYTLGFTGLMLIHFIYLCAGFLLLGLVSFGVSCIACCISGTVVESVCFSGILLLFPTVLLFSINTLMKYMLLGNAFSAFPHTGGSEINKNLIELLDFANPVLFFYKPSEACSVFYEGIKGKMTQGLNPPLLIIWSVIVFLIFAAALLALDRRRAEKAGITGLNRKMNSFAAFVLGLCVFTAIVNFLAGFDLSVSLIAATAGFTAVHIVISFVSARNGKRLMPGIVGFCIQICIVWAAVLIMFSGGLGYSGRVPGVSEILYAEFSYTGSPNYLGAEAKGSSSGKGYYVTSSYRYSSRKDLELVTELHKALVESGKKAFAPDAEDFSKTVVPYDIVVKYSLKGGGCRTRYYDRASLETLERLLALDGTDTVRDNVYAAITGNGKEALSYWAAGAFKSGDIYLSNSWYSNSQCIRLEPGRRAELLQCIAADVLGQSVKDRYFPEKPPLGIIMFSQDGESDSRSYAYNLENTLVYVTEDFKKTVGFLKSNSLYPLFDFRGEIESIKFQSYNPFDGINKNLKPMSVFFQGYINAANGSFMVEKDFGKDLIIDDPERIKELMPLLRNNYFMSDGGYFAAVKLKGSDMYVYKYLPAISAPQYVRNFSM